MKGSEGSIPPLTVRFAAGRDLYYRLRTHHLQLAPLRKRIDDVPLLVDHLVQKAASALGKSKPTVPLALLQLLKSYSFPGNARELEAMILDAVARDRNGVLSLQSCRDAISLARPAETRAPPPAVPPLVGGSFPDQLPNFKEAEEALLAEALRRADGNQGVAAGLLGITRQALNQRLKRRKRLDPSAPAQR